MEKKIKWFPAKYLTKVASEGIKNYAEKEPRFKSVIEFPYREKQSPLLFMPSIVRRLESTWKRTPFKRKSKFILEIGEYDISVGYDQTETFTFKVHIKYKNGKNRRIAKAEMK